MVCLDDGLAVVDPDAGTIELLSPYPEGMHGRANDANADPAGNLVTGTLNLSPAPAGTGGSRPNRPPPPDHGIGNANGPVVIEVTGQTTLTFGDTQAGVVYAYPDEPGEGSVGPRRIYADYTSIGGAPDGATSDADGGVWSCACLTGWRISRRPASTGCSTSPVSNPSDVTFGGAQLDRLYLTSIALDLGRGTPSDQATTCWRCRATAPAERRSRGSTCAEYGSPVMSDGRADRVAPPVWSGMRLWSEAVAAGPAVHVDADERPLEPHRFEEPPRQLEHRHDQHHPSDQGEVVVDLFHGPILRLRRPLVFIRIGCFPTTPSRRRWRRRRGPMRRAPRRR